MLFWGRREAHWIRLIAIMLGRLQMTVRQCIDAYANFARRVFGEPVSSWKLQEGRFKADNLEAVIKDLVKEQAQGDKMFDPRQGACKVYAASFL